NQSGWYSSTAKFCLAISSRRQERALFWSAHGSTLSPFLSTKRKMMRLSRKSLLLCVVTGGMLLAPASQATTVLVQAFTDLVHQADVIGGGTVTGIQERWDVARQAPFTLVTFSNLTVVKGEADDQNLTLEFLGGDTPDGMRLAVDGVPQFTVG